ncbi:uncharacterized protein LOC119097310 [Pollicipes pollicipes]|uniref:uncharacterized protein LOC119097310 n=1 Tax=Pollicipes pollicipes TaxID=41117 RepID=UPI00188531D9|nr:uncharacterized protein LOC119097310 [Pollicipes pollicipes]
MATAGGLALKEAEAAESCPPEPEQPWPTEDPGLDACLEEDLGFTTIGNSGNPWVEKAAEHGSFCLAWVRRWTRGRYEDWLFLSLLGSLMGIYSFGIDVAVQALHQFRLNAFLASADLPSRMVVWYTMTAGIAIAAALFIAWFIPSATGSGFPEMKAYLQGVKMKNTFSPLTCIGKIIFLPITLCSELPLGKEGPVTHVAAVFALFITKVFKDISAEELERHSGNELVAAACTMGAAVCYGAPVGGVLFSIEATRAYFAVRNYWRGFFAAVCGTLFYKYLSQMYHGTGEAVRWNLVRQNTIRPKQPLCLRSQPAKSALKGSNGNLQPPTAPEPAEPTPANSPRPSQERRLSRFSVKRVEEQDMAVGGLAMTDLPAELSLETDAPGWTVGDEAAEDSGRGSSASASEPAKPPPVAADSFDSLAESWSGADEPDSPVGGARPRRGALYLSRSGPDLSSRSGEVYDSLASQGSRSSRMRDGMARMLAKAASVDLEERTHNTKRRLKKQFSISDMYNRDGNDLSAMNMGQLIQKTLERTSNILTTIRSPTKERLEEEQRLQRAWRRQQLSRIVELDQVIEVEPFPLSVTVETPLVQVHRMFAMLCAHKMYVMDRRRLVGCLPLQRLSEFIAGGHFESHSEGGCGGRRRRPDRPHARLRVRHGRLRVLRPPRRLRVRLAGHAGRHRRGCGRLALRPGHRRPAALSGRGHGVIVPRTSGGHGVIVPRTPGRHDVIVSRTPGDVYVSRIPGGSGVSVLRTPGGLGTYVSRTPGGRGVSVLRTPGGLGVYVSRMPADMVRLSDGWCG